MIGVQMLFSAMILTIALLFGGVWVFQNFGIYRFDQTPQTPQAFGLSSTRVLFFVSEDGASVQAWISMPKPGRALIFSFYGNYSAIGPSFRRLEPLIDDGYGIVMLEYRGSGATAGRSGEENFARDARALYDQLDELTGQQILPERRVLHGFSLGVGVGSRLAAERPFAAVILEAAFPRACRYYQMQYRGLPFCAVMWAERYDIVDRIGLITSPKLFLHGTEDSAAPLSWGYQLYEVAPAPKTFVELTGGGHADLASYGLIPAMRKFLRQILE